MTRRREYSPVVVTPEAGGALVALVRAWLLREPFGVYSDACRDALALAGVADPSLTDAQAAIAKAKRGA